MIGSITKILTGKTPYIGKLGLDNFLLILAGILYFCLYAVKHREKPYKRLRLEFFQGMFYVVFRKKFKELHDRQYYKNLDRQDAVHREARP